jgi:acyl carrier protein
MEILEKLLRKQPAQTIVLPVNWNRFAGKQVQPLLRQIVRVKEQARSNASAVQLLEQIKTLPPNEQQNAFQEYARQQVVSILGLDASHTLHADRALTDLGLDSLMAVELKNKVEGDLHVNIPVTFFLEEATVAGLAKKLQMQINGTNGEDAKTASVDTLDAEKAKELLSSLDQLSEDEVDALINNLMPKNEDS